MRIEINNAEQAEIQPLLKAIERAVQYSANTADHIEIYIQPRGWHGAVTPSSNKEWLEYGIQIMRNSKVSIYIAMIQRTLSSEFEFHS